MKMVDFTNLYKKELVRWRRIVCDLHVGSKMKTRRLGKVRFLEVLICIFVTFIVV